MGPHHSMSAMIVKLRKLGGIGKKAGVDLELPDGLEDVTALRKLVADKLGLEGKRLRLSHKGRVLHDFGSLPKIAEGDVLSYALAPRPPDEYLRETVDGGFEEDEERELRFDIESLPSYEDGSEVYFFSPARANQLRAQSRVIIATAIVGVFGVFVAVFASKVAMKSAGDEGTKVRCVRVRGRTVDFHFPLL